MQSMQRQFTKLTHKGPGENAKVSILLNDYEDADKVIAKLIDGSRSWRDSWLSLVSAQLQAATEYTALYDPITGASDGHGRDTVPTPDFQLNRTFKLKEAYAELKTELVDEIRQIEDKVIRPASDARDCIQPIRKTIKKRENKRLDYDKCQDKVMKLQRKPGRTAKEESSLAKAEMDMANLADEFSIADNHLRETLPPIITAAFNIIPPLLAQHVMIQNRLLGLYYTTLNAYCEELGFPSPSPPMEDVIAIWNAAFRPVQREVEAISIIKGGRAAHMPIHKGLDPPARRLTAPADPSVRRTSTGLIPSTGNGAGQRLQRIPSANANPPVSPNDDYPPQPSPGGYRRPDYLAPTDFTTATILGQAPGSGALTPNSLRPPPGEYFGSNRPSTASSNVSSVSSSGIAASIAAKKKPPPPPPKRIASAGRPPDEFVTALYDFTGDNAGDLSFRQGDRIRIVKKTGTDQDWWQGELDGVKGSFPANYCRAE